MKYTSETIQSFIGIQVRLNMRLRQPLFGKLVTCSDHDEMISKGFIRFVSESRRDIFEGNSIYDLDQKQKGNIALTRLIAISDIEWIKTF